MRDTITDRQILEECGRRIKKYMKLNGLNGTQLSEITGLTQTTISQSATGHCKRLTLTTATAIAKALGVRVEYIRCEDDYPKERRDSEHLEADHKKNTLYRLLRDYYEKNSLRTIELDGKLYIYNPESDRFQVVASSFLDDLAEEVKRFAEFCFADGIINHAESIPKEEFFSAVTSAHTEEMAKSPTCQMNTRLEFFEELLRSLKSPAKKKSSRATRKAPKP